MIHRGPLISAFRSSCIPPSCLSRFALKRATAQKRKITQNHLKNKEKLAQEWAEQATEIKSGKQDSMLVMLEKRGYINQIVGDRDDLDRLMTEKRIGIYAGIDPTAPSMHVGHLLPLMVLYWSYIKGFHACSLLGGATARIGDPIGRTTTRGPQQPAERESNTARIHVQLQSMWSHVEEHARKHIHEREWSQKRELLNNDAWLDKLSALDLLKDLGQGVRLGPMLGKETVRNRMKQGEGMSFAEFTYPLLQSWDWWHMYSNKDIQVQVGGADQFGNILAGVEAVNHIRYTAPPSHEEPPSPNEAFLEKPMGFTVPLLTAASGEKFGKSAGNAIWLDRELTSAFDLYQFFLRMADADVHRYLKLLTFEPLDTLETLMEEHMKDPSKRIAQHSLARGVLKIVHGEIIAEQTEREHRSLFGRRSVSLLQNEATTVAQHTKSPDLGTVETSSSTHFLPRSLVYNQPMSRVIHHAGMVTSRSVGQRMINEKGVYIGVRPRAGGTMTDQVEFSPIGTWLGSETEKYILDGDTLILRIGKSKIRIIKIISDADFKARELSAPGWKAYLRKQSASTTAGVDDMKS